MGLNKKHKTFELDYLAIYLKRDLGYRYYNKLSEEEKVILDSAKLMPNLSIFAMKISIVHNIPIRQSIIAAMKHWDLFTEWQTNNAGGILKKYTPEKYASKEFEFQGFKPIKDIRGLGITDLAYRAIANMGLDKRYSFISSNKIIDGLLWVYPMEFANDYSDLLEGKIYIHRVFGKIGVPGHTKLIINIP